MPSRAFALGLTVILCYQALHTLIFVALDQRQGCGRQATEAQAGGRHTTTVLTSGLLPTSGTAGNQSVAGTATTTATPVPTTTTCTRHGLNYTLPRQPTFIIIGTQKGGTSAIASLLDHHPWLLSSKYFEPHYFDFFNDELHPLRRRLHDPNVVCKLRREYLRIYFSMSKLEAFPNLMAYEKTPSYIMTPNAPERVKTIVPYAKIVVTLRNPVDRVVSQYKMTYSRHWENRSFEETLAEDISVMRHYGFWTPRIDPFGTADYPTPRSRALTKFRTEGMLYRGMYSRQLQPWLEYYTPGVDLLAVSYEELQTQPMQVLQELLDFIGAPKYDFPHDLLNKSYSPSTKSWRSVEVDVDPDTLQYLQDFYRPYNQELGEMLGGKWKTVWDYKVHSS